MSRVADQIVPTRIRQLAEIRGQLIEGDLDTGMVFARLLDLTLDELCSSEPRPFAVAVAGFVIGEINGDL